MRNPKIISGIIDILNHIHLKKYYLSELNFEDFFVEDGQVYFWNFLSLQRIPEEITFSHQLALLAKSLKDTLKLDFQTQPNPLTHSLEFAIWWMMHEADPPKYVDMNQYFL